MCTSVFLLLIFARVARFQSETYYQRFSVAMGSRLAMTDQLLIFADLALSQVVIDICNLIPALDGKMVNFFRLGSVGSSALDPRGEHACAILIERTVCFGILSNQSTVYRHDEL